MKKSICLMAALGLASFATQGQAQVLFTQLAPTGRLPTPGISYRFDSTVGTGSAVFDIQAFVRLVRLGNCCTDFFILYQESAPAYSASIDLGGGGANTDLFKTVEATQSATPFGTSPSEQPSILGGLVSRFQS